MGNGPVINLQTMIKASDEIVSSKLDDQVVMMSIDKGAYFGLDEIGSRIWELLASPRTVSGLCSILIQEYDVPREECEQDILALLNELAEKNLLQITEEQSA
ncbi:MAG: lasso peptide biosynthesis PqqD family chaperone [Candidatus Latescibacteria bacterium]|nr:lasso peptide biosynthesis PqqD family chaperone [Candidatus Latescibacterota bacterium]